MILFDIQLFGKKMFCNFRQGCEMESKNRNWITFFKPMSKRQKIYVFTKKQAKI